MKITREVFKGLGLGLGAGLVIWICLFFWPTCQSAYYLGCGTIEILTCEVSKGCQTCDKADKCIDEDFARPRYTYSMIFCVIIGLSMGMINSLGIQKQKKKEQKASAIPPQPPVNRTSAKQPVARPSATPPPAKVKTTQAPPVKVSKPQSTVSICGEAFDIHTNTLILTDDRFAGFDEYDKLLQFKELKALGLLELDARYSYIFRAMKGLEKLAIIASESFDIEWLRDNTKLRTLILPSTKVENLSLLGQLTELENLSASLVGLQDITCLRDLRKLKILDISLNTAVADLSPLSGLIDLEELDVSNTSAASYSPLYTLHNLKTLRIGQIGQPIPVRVEDELQEALPDCEIEIAG